MLYEHQGNAPHIDPSAWIAPNAVVCGAVTVGPRCQIGYGAVLVAEGGRIDLGQQVIVRDHAVLRASKRHPIKVGDFTLIGPGACLFGCTIGNGVFLATRATVFYAAVVHDKAEVRVNGVVHVASVVPKGATVPIGWIAVGDPAQFLPPEAHDRIWAIQEPLNFPAVAYGLDRLPGGGVDMREVTARLASSSSAHRNDQRLE